MKHVGLWFYVCMYSNTTHTNDSNGSSVATETVVTCSYIPTLAEIALLFVTNRTHGGENCLGQSIQGICF